MKEFVDDCRGQWRLLRVPDQVADEMAAELAADLQEAEAEGVPAEEVLGSGALDPRAFATAWAAERGVIGQALPSGNGRSRGSLLAAAVGSLALVLAIVGGVLLIVDVPSGSPSALSSAVRLPGAAVWVAPSNVGGPVSPPEALSFRVDGGARVIRVAVSPPSARLTAPAGNDSEVDRRELGSVLLIVGLVGLALSTVFVLWIDPKRRRAATV